MQVHHAANLRYVLFGPMERVIDGQKMFRGQLVDPLDRESFAAARIEHHAGNRSAVGPQSRGRQITVQLARNRAHRHPVMLRLFTVAAGFRMHAERPRHQGKRQGIDEACKGVGIEIRHHRRRRARHGVGERAARKSRTGGGQSRALNESTAACHAVNLGAGA
jgi:hypothetical protein